MLNFGDVFQHVSSPTHKTPIFRRAVRFLRELTRYFLQQIKYGFGCFHLLPVDLTPLALRVIPSWQRRSFSAFGLGASTWQPGRYLLLFIQPCVEVTPTRAFRAFPPHLAVLAAVWRGVRVGRVFFAGVFGWGQRLLWPGSGQSFKNDLKGMGQGIIGVLRFILRAGFRRVRLLFRLRFLHLFWNRFVLWDDDSGDHSVALPWGGSQGFGRVCGFWIWKRFFFHSFCSRAGALWDKNKKRALRVSRSS